LLSWFFLSSADSSFHDSNRYYGTQTDLKPAVVKRLAELQKEEDALRERERQLNAERFMNNSRDVGRLIVTARRHDAGYALLAALRGKAPNLGRSYQRFIESMAWSVQRLGAASPVTEIRTRMRELEDERWRLMQNRP
jgi:hypothetical protein